MIGLRENMTAELAKTKKTLNSHQIRSLAEGGVWGSDETVLLQISLAAPTMIVQLAMCKLREHCAMRNRLHAMNILVVTPVQAS